MSIIDRPRTQFKLCDNTAEYEIGKMKDFAKKNKITLSQAMEFYTLLAYQRRTDAYIENGDAEDEQAYMISGSLDNIAENIEKVFYSLDKMAFSNDNDRS